MRIFDRDAANPGTGGNPGHVLDILLVSSERKPELWCQMKPNRDVLATTYSSVTRYPLGGVDQVVTAVPLEARSAILDDLRNGHVDCPIRFRLEVAELRGVWRGLGDLELTERRDEDDPSLRFMPPRAGRLRRFLYKWCQRR